MRRKSVATPMALGGNGAATQGSPLRGQPWALGHSPVGAMKGKWTLARQAHLFNCSDTGPTGAPGSDGSKGGREPTPLPRGCGTDGPSFAGAQDRTIGKAISYLKFQISEGVENNEFKI